MANEQGRYTGETVTGIIGENVGLGQVVYSRTISTTNPDVQNRGVWFSVSANEENETWIVPGLMPKYVGSNQLGVVVQAATYSEITATQSGTETTILLKGYYSPGFMAYPNVESGVEPGYFYASPGAACGAPLYLLPREVVSGTYSRDTRGGFSSFLPSYPGIGATQGAVRIIGYAYDLNYPYVVRFEPDNTWIEF
jgi:hypothetical protein